MNRGFGISVAILWLCAGCGTHEATSAATTVIVTASATVTATTTVTSRATSTPTASPETSFPSTSESYASDATASAAPSESPNYAAKPYPTQVGIRLGCSDLGWVETSDSGLTHQLYSCTLGGDGRKVDVYIFNTNAHGDKLQGDIEGAGHTVFRDRNIMVSSRTPDETNVLKIVRERWTANECRCAQTYG